MIHVGINALYLIPGGVGGTEIYLRALLAALARIGDRDRFVVFANQECGTDLTPRAVNFDTVVLPVRAASRPARIIVEQTLLPREARRRGIDVLFNPGFTAPLFAPCPQVTVFHDLQHKRHPEHFRWFDLPFWRFLLWASARRSGALLAVSKATAEDLDRFYHLPAGCVHVIPHGVDERFFEIGEERRNIPPERFLLCVSTLHPHKNLERLVQAFGRFRAVHPDFRLVLAGMKGFHAEPIEELIASLGLTDSVRLTGWIPREELHGLYRTAWAFVYPSTFEGFGMPVLEAMAAGIPTACSSIEPLHGIALDGAEQFPPEDIEAMTGCLERIANDETLRHRLREAGPARARHFTWDECARQTLQLLTETAG